MLSRIGWTVMFTGASLITLYAVAVPFLPGADAPIVRARLVTMPIALSLHLAGAATALFVGALQHNGWLRRVAPAVHRALGRVYVLGVLVGGTGALLLAPRSEGGMSAHLGFGMLGVLWIGATLEAFRHARARRLARHRAWMIRSYALTFAAVTLRIQIALGVAFGIPFESSYPVIAWTAWVPNLLVAEWLVRRGWTR